MKGEKCSQYLDTDRLKKKFKEACDHRDHCEVFVNSYWQHVRHMSLDDLTFEEAKKEWENTKDPLTGKEDQIGIGWAVPFTMDKVYGVKVDIKG